MNRKAFWDLIAVSRNEALKGPQDGILDRQAEYLTDWLDRASVGDRLSFNDHAAALAQQAYSWDLWGAACVMASLVTDDGFTDFRYWLISMGEVVYSDALSDPESLAAVSDDPTVEDFFFEEFPFADVESSESELSLSQILSREPAGQKFRTFEELRPRFPRLWAVFQDEDASDSGGPN